jgi:hypothetical protein
MVENRDVVLTLVGVHASGGKPTPCAGWIAGSIAAQAKRCWTLERIAREGC